MWQDLPLISAVSFADIESLEWTKIPRGGALNVRQQGKPTSVFVGFREQVRQCVRRRMRSEP